MRTHSFHIPVMGTGFTIDSPIKVARLGITSVISLVDDELIEQMRRHYSIEFGEPYHPITSKVKDHRALRITAYLNLVEQIVQRQFAQMKQQSFDEDNDLRAYFELLDDASLLKGEYLRRASMNGSERTAHEAFLKGRMRMGAIDVNIMVKADRENTFNGEKLPREYSDALAALRGFAQSSLRSSVVFSAGMNPSLFSYCATFEDFYAHDDEPSRKSIILKVSDFRSAAVQSKVLAMKGVWVSEYRIESGLNCGGHAFATTGLLLGPILEEFKAKRRELQKTLFQIYQEALVKQNRTPPREPPRVVITAQGGVGTASEHRFMLSHYELESVGWGTPFLLVPEATTVDDTTLAALVDENKDVYLSDSSPLGLPFYTLRNSSSEECRRARINAGKPGSACLNKHLAFNTEYGEPLCVASRHYQRKKLAELKNAGLTDEACAQASAAVLEKACICRHLGDGARAKYGIKVPKTTLTPAMCPGPNIAFFSRVCSLSDMVGHIYARNDVRDKSQRRPHVFVNELKLYIDKLDGMITKAGPSATEKECEYFAEFKQNLFAGIDYYMALTRVSSASASASETATERMRADLQAQKDRLVEGRRSPDLGAALRSGIDAALSK